MKLSKLILAVVFGLAMIVGLNACGDDDPGICDGIYASENECEDAIKGADNCKCEVENDLWIAVPDN